MIEWVIISTIIVSLISLVGIITLLFKDRLFKKILMGLVALSAGALLGGAFLHLLPEAMNEFGFEGINEFVIIGFVLFFIVEKTLGWRHCHDKECKVHTFAYMNLFGEAIHNFIDGIIIASSYTINFELGVATTIAVIMHEIPQEIGDFGVLVYGGYSKKKAITLNLLIALTCVLGGVIGFYISNSIDGFTKALLPLAAGGFIYISASDLIPELKKEVSLGKSMATIITFLAGISLMMLL
ncbi:MAG: ZIP family metal transporter [Candidatus Nanoarchaeia archaeon]|jgi:zinc and cadmium transporter